jgi:hypothetical protein
METSSSLTVSEFYFPRTLYTIPTLLLVSFVFQHIWYELLVDGSIVVFKCPSHCAFQHRRHLPANSLQSDRYHLWFSDKVVLVVCDAK